MTAYLRYVCPVCRKPRHTSQKTPPPECVMCYLDRRERDNVVGSAARYTP